MRTAYLRIILILSAISAACGCAHKQVRSDMDTQTFCEKAYGPGSKVFFVTEGHPIRHGMAEDLTGFKCVYDTKQPSSDPNCKEDAYDHVVRCFSKKYPLEELCPNEELKRYWDTPDLYEGHCR